MGCYWENVLGLLEFGLEYGEGSLIVRHFTI
jgi:hypothetical protein